MKNPVYGSTASEKQTEDWKTKFNEKFAVQHNPWGDDFCWADDADSRATEIKQFIRDELNEQVHKIKWWLFESGKFTNDELLDFKKKFLKD